MPDTTPPLIVVEDDPFLRVVQIILDPDTPGARAEAFSHFFASDLDDFPGWSGQLRRRLARLYPARVRLVRDEAELHEWLPGAAVVIVESLSVGTAEIAAAGSNLKIVQKYGSLIPNIDRRACEENAIQLLTLRRRANVATAEHALALMLALARKLAATANLVTLEQVRRAGYDPTRYDLAHTPNGNWARIKGLRTLFGLDLGIIGMGEIGREFAARAVPFGMHIAYTQRHRLPETEEKRYQAHYTDLDDLLARSDYISVHLPGGAGTRGLIGRRELERVKPGASIVNVSQPGIIDRDALIDALASGRLAGFAMDLPYEEPGRTDDPLMQCPNVLVTPHLGGSPRFNALGDFEEMMLDLDKALGERDHATT